MRNTWLVFMRDYLGYVRAWGFWLGILATPLIIALVAFIFTLNAASQPTRYYTVIETGSEFAAALDQRFAERRERLARAQMIALEETGVLERGAVAAFDAALQTGAAPDEAAIQAGAPETFSIPEADFIRVPPPADTADALLPWLLGERMVDGPLGEKPLFAAIVPGDNEIEYWSENVTVGGLKGQAEDAATAIARQRVFSAQGVDPDILEEARAATPDVVSKRARPAEQRAELGDTVTLADRAPFYAAVAIAYVLWLMIFSVIQYLLMGTIEERSNKIFDSLLTAVKLPQLLAGKLLAVFAVTLTLMSAWTIGGTIMTLFLGSVLPADAMGEIASVLAAVLTPSIVIPALISFVLGYLMYGVVFMALGSLCDTIQEAQTLLSPMMMLLMLPMLMIVISFNDLDSPIVSAMSWVPIFTPFLLILRMPSEPPMWEVLAQFGLMAATTALILWGATKVYRAGAVHGAGISDAMSWLKGLIPGLGGKKEADVKG
ncbi:MAG: ABC transporter permease [Pseudomonadota bacterium]